MEPFFNTEKTRDILRCFISMLKETSSDKEFSQSRNQMTKTILGFMLSAPKEWDKNCQITIDWIGSYFISLLDTERSKIEGSEQGLDELFACCFRFLLELYLSKQGDLVSDLNKARDFGVENIGQFTATARLQMQYAINQMPLALFKEIANSDEISSLSEFNKLTSHAKKLKTDWDQEIKDKKLEVDQLKDGLGEYKTGFNFVGLYQGFDLLGEEKDQERADLVFWLRGISVFIILVVIAELVLVGVFWSELPYIETQPLIILFPAISIMAVSLYFFRVLLFNYKSVKSQLLQINLRKTLCRFIQAYAVYASDVEEKHKDSLERFESIIFSGLEGGEDSPSAKFDGLDQINRFVKSIKS